MSHGWRALGSGLQEADDGGRALFQVTSTGAGTIPRVCGKIVIGVGGDIPPGTTWYRIGPPVVYNPIVTTP